MEAFLRRPSDSPRVSRCSEPRSTASWIRRGVLSSWLGPHEGKFPTTPKDVPESQAAKRTLAELPLPFPAGSPRWRGAMSPSTIASSHTLSINWVLAPVCHQTHRGARRGTLASDSPVSVSFRFGGEHRTLGAWEQGSRLVMIAIVVLCYPLLQPHLTYDAPPYTLSKPRGKTRQGEAK